MNYETSWWKLQPKAKKNIFFLYFDHFWITKGQRWPGILNQCDMAVLVVEFFKPGWQTATPIEDRVVTLSTSTYQFIYFFSLQLVYTNVCETSNKDNTQVGSPAVRLRLARCTAWVKRWSEAMDFLQTIWHKYWACT